LRDRFEHLVDLLLVFDHRVSDLRVVEHVDEFHGRRVLIHGHRDPAERLRRDHRPVQARPVVADDREMHAPPEPFSGQSAGERAHLRRDFRPGPRLPDAEVFLAGRGTVAALGGVLLEQAWKSHAASISCGHRSNSSCFSGRRGQPCRRRAFMIPATRPGATLSLAV
jgi:hypothetical protein